MGLVLFLLSLFSADALAQGFDGQRHTPPAGSAGGLAVDRAEVPAVGSVALFAGFGLNAVQFRRDGEVVARPLNQLLVIDAMGSIGIPDLLELGVSVPLAPLYKGDALTGPEYQLAAGPGVGDIRLVPKLALLGHAGQDGLKLGFAMPIRLPTGNEVALRGSGEPSIEPELLLGGEIGPLGVHGSAGFRIRPGLDAEDLVGQEVTYGLAVALHAIDTQDLGLDVLLEGFGAIDVDRPGPELTDFPLELHAGIALRPISDLTLTLAGGPGLTNGLGTPAGRVYLGVRFAPGAKSSKPSPKDLDGDGIKNEADKCPRKAEDRDGFQDRDGCPDLDNDQDGVPDDDDQCPNQAEGKPGDGDGCPDSGQVRRSGNRIEYEGRIHFAFDKWNIDPRSGRLLDNLAAYINDLEVRRIVIQGHTDSIGTDAYNMDLSRKRSESVRSALIGRKVEEDLLVTRSFGERRPIAPNETPAGRARNRRVEFVIKE